ncbi:helix-turn-helix domain-containing protein [Domibacillus robiginosus]|uniref:helix-turn-helix domain-containing protein n=1 Tax=Domibacillus robiginosus TaxID=1071054 RepID=UPI00067E526B|nr:helix-turn-helix transcriptional regulator [Domibacillus robiginosus]
MIGERLKKLRKEKKLTQEELGKKVNVTKVSISGYETGNRSPDSETLQKLADFFNVSIDYLLGRSDLKNIDLLDEDIRMLNVLHDSKNKHFFKEISLYEEEKLNRLLKVWNAIKDDLN